MWVLLAASTDVGMGLDPEWPSTQRLRQFMGLCLFTSPTSYLAWESDLRARPHHAKTNKYYTPPMAVSTHSFGWARRRKLNWGTESINAAM